MIFGKSYSLIRCYFNWTLSVNLYIWTYCVYVLFWSASHIVNFNNWHQIWKYFIMCIRSLNNWWVTKLHQKIKSFWSIFQCILKLVETTNPVQVTRTGSQQNYVWIKFIEEALIIVLKASTIIHHESSVQWTLSMKSHHSFKNEKVCSIIFMIKKLGFPFGLCPSNLKKIAAGDKWAIGA